MDTEGWDEEEGKGLSFSIPGLERFGGMKGKSVYAALEVLKEHQWLGYLRGQSMAALRWRVLCRLPLSKRAGDLQWRVIHGALVTSTFLSKVDSNEGCVYCGLQKTEVHTFVACS